MQYMYMLYILDIDTDIRYYPLNMLTPKLYMSTKVSI